MNNYCLILLLLASCLAKEPQLPNHVVPLYGNTSLGYYYANIFVGSPAQQQSVIVDTGSGQLALPCSKCLSCGKSHLQPPFKLSQSQTSKIITCSSQEQVCKRSCPGKIDSQSCTFSISYAEGSSLSGIIIEDQIQFQNDSEGESIKTAFGCTTRQTNLFFTQAANGIFGLAPARQSKLLQKLYNKHSSKTGQQLLFTLCLAKNGGQLVIGKARPEIHNKDKSVKTEFVTAKNLYTLVGVGQITIKDRVIKESDDSGGHFGVFIDSGSTFTYLPRKNFQILSQALEQACSTQSEKCQRSKLNSNCFKVKPEGNATIRQTVLQIFSNLHFGINGEPIQWSPTDYFYLRGLKAKQVCLGIESLDRFILGANWMVNRDIVFNLKQRTVQIFSNALCSIQLKQTQSQQILELEMPLYGEESSQFSLLDGIFSENNSFLETLIILVTIMGFFLALLVTIGRYFGLKNTKVHKQSNQQEQDTIQNLSFSQRQIQKAQSIVQLAHGSLNMVITEENSEQVQNKQ